MSWGRSLETKTTSCPVKLHSGFRWKVAEALTLFSGGSRSRWPCQTWPQSSSSSRKFFSSDHPPSPPRLRSRRCRDTRQTEGKQNTKNYTIKGPEFLSEMPHFTAEFKQRPSFDEKEWSLCPFSQILISSCKISWDVLAEYVLGMTLRYNQTKF